MAVILLDQDSQDDVDFHAILRKHGTERCKSCHTPVDRGSLAWNNGASDCGTPFVAVTIICQACDAQIAHVECLTQTADDFSEVVTCLDNDWWG